MPRFLGCHLILRNIKSIIMFHLLWDIYLCFDQITKNIQITNTHICGGKTWGREIINAPWGHWWFLSLYGCCRDRDVWWWNVGFPNHLALDWLWAKRTLWIRHIPQSTRIIVPSRTSCTRSHSLRGCSLYALCILLLYSFLHFIALIYILNSEQRPQIHIILSPKYYWTVSIDISPHRYIFRTQLSFKTPSDKAQ